MRRRKRRQVAAHHEELQGQVRGILILAEKFLRPQSVREYEEDIDHNEYGLALDSMVYELVDRSLPLPRELVERIVSMSSVMYPGEDRDRRMSALLTLVSDDAGGVGQDEPEAGGQRLW